MRFGDLTFDAAQGPSEELAGLDHKGFRFPLPSVCIRPALHAARAALGFSLSAGVTYCRYFPSSRLVSRAHRQSRCDAGLSPRSDSEASPQTPRSLLSRGIPSERVDSGGARLQPCQVSLKGCPTATRSRLLGAVEEGPEHGGGVGHRAHGVGTRRWSAWSSSRMKVLTSITRHKRPTSSVTLFSVPLTLPALIFVGPDACRNLSRSDQARIHNSD